MPLSYCYRIITIRYLEFNRQNNNYKLTSKINSTLDTYDILIEIRPNYDISYMLAEAEVFDICTSESKFDVSLMIIIILSTIIVVIITVFIILKCKQSKLSNLTGSIENPLLPDNQS